MTTLGSLFEPRWGWHLYDIQIVDFIETYVYELREETQVN